MRRLFSIAITAVIAGATSLAPAAAQTVEEFYRGKTITMYVGTGVGAGAVSAYPMAMAPVIRKYIPGNPNIVVAHMPGAGGIKAATYVESVGSQDGTAWGFITRGFMLAPLLMMPHASFAPRHILDMPRIHQQHLNPFFQYPVHGFPILAGRFHRHVGHLPLLQPVAQCQKIPGLGPEGRDRRLPLPPFTRHANASFNRVA